MIIIPYIVYILLFAIFLCYFSLQLRFKLTWHISINLVADDLDYFRFNHEFVSKSVSYKTEQTARIFLCLNVVRSMY